MYPQVIVDLAKIRHNVQVVRTLADNHNLDITAVSKVFAGDPSIAKAFCDAGITTVGDSRVANLQQLRHLPLQTWLIRQPMLSEVDQVVRFADVSLNSEIAVIQALSQAAKEANVTHNIILMADLGDIREGFIDREELISAAKKTVELPNVELFGIGTNLTCFSFIQPDGKKMGELAALARAVEDATGVSLSVVSGGNSAAINTMLKGEIPDGVTNLRLGESLLFGKERATYTFLPDTYNDAFILECEIVELKTKPSLPWGTMGVDSYGEKPVITDRGPKRRKAICALGKQDIDLPTCETVDSNIIMLGSSSDHIMLDVTDCDYDYNVGDIVSFRLGYFATMRAFTSSYVHRTYLNAKE